MSKMTTAVLNANPLYFAISQGSSLNTENTRHKLFGSISKGEYDRTVWVIIMGKFSIEDLDLVLLLLLLSLRYKKYRRPECIK